MVMATSLLFGACSGDGKTCDRATQQKGNTENVIGRSDIKVKDGRMTPEVLWAMGRIGGMNVSPDGQKVVYTVAYYSVPENTGRTISRLQKRLIPKMKLFGLKVEKKSLSFAMKAAAASFGK